MIPFLSLMAGILLGIIIGAAFASDIGAHRTGRIRTIGGDLPLATLKAGGMRRVGIPTKWRKERWS